MEKYLNILREIRRIYARFCEKICRFCDFGTIRRISCDFINAPHFTKTLFWGVVLYLIALFALLRGDIYYADDLNRAISDYGGNYYSRHFTEFILTKALSFGKGTLDISPLPQVLGIVFIVLSAMILLYLIRGKFDFIGILASLPLGLSPHFLQNLSYKFDSLTMSFALFLAVLPFLFQKHTRIFCAFSVVCLLLMFMTYQAANASYIILSLYFALFMRADFRQGAGFLGLCAINLIVASALYKLTINPVISGVSDKIFAFDALLVGILQNLAQYFSTIFNDLKQTPYIWLITLNCALFIANAIFCKHRRIYAIFKVILFLALGSALSYGLYLVLENPLFHPRAYYGLNALVAIICIANVTESSLDSAKMRQILRFLSIASIVITAYFLISFANIYGNALKKQDEYLDFRAQLLLQYLGEKIPRGASIIVDISEMRHAKVTQRFYEKYGDARIIPRLSPRGDFWFEMKLRHLGAPYNFGDAEICDTLKAQFGSEVAAENAWHRIEKVKVCYVAVVR